MARTSELYAKEGYGEKVIALPAFHKIVSAASSVGLQLQKGDDGDLVDTHAVLDLLKRLNAINSGSDFIYALTAWRRIADEAFIVRQPFGSAGKLAKGKPTSCGFWNRTEFTSSKAFSACRSRTNIRRREVISSRFRSISRRGKAMSCI
jgi:hypothetical protein